MADSPVWFRFFIEDFERDTRDLSCEQVGIYLRLLMRQYSLAGPIPDTALKRLALSISLDLMPNEPSDPLAALEEVLGRFFVISNDALSNPRAVREIAHWRREVANKRAAVAVREHNKINGHRSDDRLVMHQNIDSDRQNQNQNQNKAKEANASLSTAAEAAAARRLLEFLNERAQRSYKPIDAHIKLIRARLKEHGEPTLRTMLAIKCREWRTDPKMSEYLRPGTLFNATKCADYVGRVGTFEENT